MANSQSLLARLLSTPDLPAVVPRLEPSVLHRIIRTCGLEDCSELIAYATPAQLAEVFDVDLWRARTPGAEERFDADRFGLWLAVLLDAGPDVAAQKLAGLDDDLIIAGFSQHIVVSDQAAVAPYMTLDGELTAGRASTARQASEIGGYVIEARRTSAWDPIVELLAFLAAERSDEFQRLMRGLVRLSNGAREEDASHRLLEDVDQHLFDLGVQRDARRERGGYVTSTDARAFLQSARNLDLAWHQPEPSPLARAYFRAFEAPLPKTDAGTPKAPGVAPVDTVLGMLRDAGVLDPPPRALLEAGDASVTRLAWIEQYIHAHPDTARDLAYLANVIVSGCSVQGRPFTEREAGDAVVATCNLGLENWPADWPKRDLVTAFQIGWKLLQRDVCMYAAGRLAEMLATLECADRDTWLQLDSLRRRLIRNIADGEPWRARDALDVLLTLDSLVWAGLLGLIDEYPVLHRAIDGTRGLLTIDPADFRFVSQNRDLDAVRTFIETLQL